MTTRDDMPDTAAARVDARIAGIALIAATLLSVVMMAHHPTAGTHDHAALAADIASKTTPSRIVHGVLIALIVVELFAFTTFAMRIAWRSAARAGFVAYAVGAGAMIGAALVSGFIVSDLALHYAGAADAAAFADFARVCMAANQALAKLGTIATSAGIVLWSIALLREPGTGRWLAWAGFVAGLAPAIALLAGAIRLDVHGMTLVVIGQAAWNLAAGVALIRARP
jgi:hypothetical protein